MLSDVQNRRELRTAKWYLFGAGCGLLVVLAARLFALQIAGWEYYRVRSEANRIRAVPIAAARGLILDRNGEILVDNAASYDVSIVPGGLKQQDISAVIERLAGLVDLDQDAARKKVLAQRGSYQPVKLKRDVSIQTVSALEERCLELPGIIYQTQTTRSYPFGRLACHILGHVGEISEAEFARLQTKGYLPGDLAGKDGIESEREADLRGDRGVRYVETNARGREIRGFPERAVAAVPGANVVLTIDRRLQQVAERAFPDGMAGGLVALDPRNGEVLVALSSPGFDPSIFSGGLAKEDWSKLHDDPMHPLLNRAVQSAYPPGSTFKMVPATAGLETGILDFETLYQPCRGSILCGDREFRCWGRHGRLNVTDAIIQSCDVFFYQLALRLNLDALSGYGARFGFGQPTGIDLQYESAGNMPSRAYYDQRYGKRGWSKGMLLNLCIGQGEILASPLQMARYVAAVATGKLCAPHLVRGLDGERRSWSRPECQDIEVSPRTLQGIRAAMVGVVEHPRGTAHASRIAGLELAGKTGTAQNPHGKDHAWFVAFAPAQDPTIAVAAIVENGGHGSSVAAPIVTKVIQAHLRPEAAQLTRMTATRG